MNAPIGEEWKQLDEATQHYNPKAFTTELEAAQKRIREIRCKDVDLLITDRTGQPVRGLPVEIQQTASAFCWGDQLWELDTLFRHGLSESDRVRHFTRRFTECLNSANCLSYWTEAPRNDGPKHMEFQGEDHLDGFAAQVDWALKNGLTPKGHPIFWSIEKAYPEWLKRYPFETQWKFIEVRVRNLVARFKGKVKIWDLINEPMWEAAPKNLPQRNWPHLESLEDICEYIVPIMRWAREEDPDAKYIINDYGMETDPEGWVIRHKDGHHVTAKSQRDRFVALFRRLADEGACPDGLGMQAHTGAWMIPAMQNAILDEFAESGMPLHYTEFWAHDHHLIKAGVDPKIAAEMKAEYIANIMTVAFAHSAVDSFYFWGEIPGSFGFRNDHNSCGLPSSSHEPTPTYWRVRELLQKEWMTRTSLVTDADGRARFRGFFGDYSLRYAAGPSMPAGVAFSVDKQHEGIIHLVVHNKAGVSNPGTWGP
jgi:GH35 family endo-1,4-beta-xylanase